MSWTLLSRTGWLQTQRDNLASKVLEFNVHATMSGIEELLVFLFSSFSTFSFPKTFTVNFEGKIEHSPESFQCFTFYPCLLTLNFIYTYIYNIDIHTYIHITDIDILIYMGLDIKLLPIKIVIL